jgi:MFS transporter, DHA1 family, multidrug resistance protein
MNKNKRIFLASIAGFNTALSFTLVSSFLPIYLDMQGISLSSIGFIFAFGAMVAGILRFPIGTITDRIGRRPLMLLGAIGYPIFAIGVLSSTTSTEFVTVKLLIEIFGAVFWTAFWAYIYDIIHRGKEGRDLSYSNMLIGIHAVLAPAIGGFVIAYYAFSYLFYLSIAIGFINIIFIAFIINEKVYNTRESVQQIREDIVNEYRDIMSIKKFRIYLAIGSLHNITWAIWYVYMPIYLRNIGVSFQQIGIILAAMGLVAISTQYPIGKLIDKFPSKYLIIPGFILVWMSGYIFLAVQDFAGIVLSRASMSFGFSLRWNPLVARLSHITSRKEHGGITGLFRAGNALTVGVVTVIAGYLSEIYGIKAILWGASTFSLLIAFILLFINTGLMQKGRIKLQKHHLMHVKHTYRKE